jgi:hypothetical protein
VFYRQYLLSLQPEHPTTSSLPATPSTPAPSPLHPDPMDEDFEASTMSDGFMDRRPRKRSVNLALSLEDLYKGGTKKLKVRGVVSTEQLGLRSEKGVKCGQRGRGGGKKVKKPIWQHAWHQIAYVETDSLVAQRRCETGKQGCVGTERSCPGISSSCRPWLYLMSPCFN